MVDVDRLSATFRALANPERLTVLAAVASRRRGVNISQTCELTGLPRLAVTRHLSKLRFAGLVSSRWEGRAHIHWLAESAVEQVEDWVYAVLPESGDPHHDPAELYT